jgi:hypothetical protein
VVGGGHLKAVDEVNGGWIAGREPGRGESTEDKPGEQQHAGDGQRLAANPGKEGAGREGGKKRHRHQKNTRLVAKTCV